MPIILELAGQEVHIEQKDFTLDFIANKGGFNAIPINEDPLTVYKGDFDDLKDGLTFLNKLLAANGLSPIPCKITHTDPTIGLLKQGRYDTRKNDYTCKTANIYVISEFEDFITRSETLNLRKLIDSKDIKISDYQRVGYVLEMDTRSILSLLFTMIVNLLNLFALINEIKNALVKPEKPWVLVLMYIQLAALVAIEIQMAIEFIKQKPKKSSYYCIPVKTLLTNACKHLGYSFESSILDSQKFKNMVLIGDTEHTGVSKNKTPKNNPVPDITLATLISAVNNIFRTKIVVKNNSVSLEEESFFYQNPSEFIIPRTQDKENNPLTATHNVGEISLSYGVGFATDSSDRNTTKGNFGNKVTAHYLVKQFLQSRNSDFFAEPTIKSIPFARAARKNELESAEKTYNSIIKTLSAPLRLLGLRTSELLIQDEVKKCFKLETHGINTTKILISDGNGFVSKDNSETLDAKNLYNEYHKKYTLAGGRDGFAFWTNFKGSLESGLCQDDNPNFLLSKLNTTLVAKTKEGQTAVITRHSFNDSTNSHDFEYRAKGWINIIGWQFSNITTPKVTEKLTIDIE